jgi:hypothetical protein
MISRFLLDAAAKKSVALYTASVVTVVTVVSMIDIVLKAAALLVLCLSKWCEIYGRLDVESVSGQNTKDRKR